MKAEILMDDSSGKSMNREGLQRVLALVKSKSVDAVIVAKLDRLTRKLRDLLETWRCSSAPPHANQLRNVLDNYEQKYVKNPDNLSASTRDRYLSQIKNHVRPAFGDLAMAEVTTKRIDDWLSVKARGEYPLAWASRVSLRKLPCGIFTQAATWGWQGANPAINVSVGRQRAACEKRKLTDEQTRDLLAALPEDLRLICMVALFCTLRISEVLGLQWKHIDWERGALMVRQRSNRGDLDEPKTLKAKRDLPFGHLAERLRAIWPGAAHDDEFVFGVKTSKGICRDYRDLNNNLLRPAAKALGIYRIGFGFHALRREAITSISAAAGVGQAMNAAGRTKVEMSQSYTLADYAEQKKAICAHQVRILGLDALPAEEVPDFAFSDQDPVRFGPNWKRN